MLSLGLADLMVLSSAEQERLEGYGFACHEQNFSGELHRQCFAVTVCCQCL
jgi:hypothetical protein